MIAISVQFNESFRPVADLTIPLMEEYCARHGYELIVNNVEQPRRSIVWDRYLIIQERLKEFDWIVHFDADLLITNMHITLEDIISNAGHAHVIVSKAWTEQLQQRFNDGVIFWRNAPRAFVTLKAMLDEPEDDFVRCGQDALERLWLKGYIPDPCFIRQAEVNAFDYRRYNMSEKTPGQWVPGLFCLHMPGMNLADRVALIQETLPKVLR